jgi:hypothetical protein
VHYWHGKTACAGVALIVLSPCHALTALPPGKVPTVLSGQDAGRATEPVKTPWKTEKSLPLLGNEPQLSSLPACSSVAIL